MKKLTIQQDGPLSRVLSTFGNNIKRTLNAQYFNQMRPTTQQLVKGFIEHVSQKGYTHIISCDVSDVDLERKVTTLKRVIQDIGAIRDKIEITRFSHLTKEIYDQRGKYFETGITDFSVNENEYKHTIHQLFHIEDPSRGVLLIKAQDKKKLNLFLQLLKCNTNESKPFYHIQQDDVLVDHFSLTDQQHQMAQSIIYYFSNYCQHIEVQQNGFATTLCMPDNIYFFCQQHHQALQQFCIYYQALYRSKSKIRINARRPITHQQAMLINNIHLLYPNINSTLYFNTLAPPIIIRGNKNCTELEFKINNTAIAEESLKKTADAKPTPEPKKTITKEDRYDTSCNIAAGIEKASVNAGAKKTAEKVSAKSIDLNLETQISEYLKDDTNLEKVERHILEFTDSKTDDLEIKDTVSDYTVEELCGVYNELLMLFILNSEKESKINSSSHALHYHGSLINQHDGCLNCGYTSLVAIHCVLKAIISEEQHSIQHEMDFSLTPDDSSVDIDQALKLFDYIIQTRKCDYGSISLLLKILDRNNLPIPNAIQSNFIKTLPKERYNQHELNEKQLLQEAIKYYDELQDFDSVDLLDCDDYHLNLDDIAHDIEHTITDSKEQQKCSPRSDLTSSSDGLSASQETLTMEALAAYEKACVAESTSRYKSGNGINITNLCLIAIDEDNESVITSASSIATTKLFKTNEHSKHNQFKRGISTKAIKKTLHRAGNRDSRVKSYKQSNGRTKLSDGTRTIIVTQGQNHQDTPMVVTAWHNTVRERPPSKKGKTKEKKKPSDFNSKATTWAPLTAASSPTPDHSDSTTFWNKSYKKSFLSKADSKQDFPDLSARNRK